MLAPSGTLLLMKLPHSTCHTRVREVKVASRNPCVGLLVSLVLVVPRVGRADCVEPITSVRLLLTIEDAEAAFGRLDLDAFQSRVDESALLLPCLSETASRPLAARLHRLQGLRAWLLRDTTRAEQAFLSSRRIEPSYRFPTELVPEQHPTRESYLALPLDEGGVVELPTPSVGSLMVDGRVSHQRPLPGPSVVQWIADSGAVNWTQYSWEATELPPFSVLAVEPASPDRWRVPLLVAAGSSLLVSGTLYALAASSHSRWEDPATPASETDRLRSQTNGLWVGSMGAGGLALGAGAAAAWTFR